VETQKPNRRQVMNFSCQKHLDRSHPSRPQITKWLQIAMFDGSGFREEAALGGNS
jgi:hypothetical protein